MNRLRLIDVRKVIARVINQNETTNGVTTQSIIDYLNESQARLMAKGKWVGTIVRYKICVGSDSCLVWPRQVETIESWSLCTNPGDIRNRWYEFSGEGPGIIKDSDNWFRTLIDTDPVPMFEDMSDNNNLKKVQITADVVESAGAQILLQGYDNNMNWIRTKPSTTWIDGEYVNITNGPIESVNYFQTVTGVQKPITNGPVRLAEVDKTLGLVVKQLAYYESDETTPIYRRSFLPGMQNQSGCDSSSTGCASKNVNVICKLRHVDVRNDNDWLVIGNVSALKLMVMSILKEERNIFKESAIYEERAIKELQNELQSYQGDGEIPTLKSENRQTWGAGVLNAIDPNYYVWY